VTRFITPALKAGEPVVAVIPPERGELLRRDVGESAAEVEILDMFELGRNPARIIPALERMLAKHEGTTLHCVGEPVWPGRSAEEIQEAAKHEALINLAWPGAPIRLLCLYDAERLEPEVLADAERTHPTVIEGGTPRRTSSYSGAAVPEGSDQPLPPVPDEARELAFTIDQLHDARQIVDREASAAGLDRVRVEDLMLAVSELATNAIRYGRGRGMLHVWRRPDRLVCQVEDGGTIRDPLAGRRTPIPRAAGGIGLWAVNQLCDLVEVRSTKGGTTTRIHAILG
jgi:anti-sigma regulatory factor (Ser/Thr protein kinase)